MFGLRVGGHASTRRLILAAAYTAMSALVMLGLPRTAALFTTDQQVNAELAAGRIFVDERVTPAFAVADYSSGALSDGSSSSSFSNDARYFLTRSWPAAFATDRYIDIELNSPLPAELSATNSTLWLQIASDNGSGSVCIYLEARRASTNALLSSHGSAASPLACTSSSTYSALNVALPAVTTTDIANDLRVRIFARDSAGGAIRLDEATLAGDTPYSTFRLYPTLTREAYSGQTELIRWGLAEP